MSVESQLAKLFGLRGEDAWRRHANPWSVYTRISIPCCSSWRSGAGFGSAGGRCCPSRSVLGETVWARRKETPLPARHRTAPLVLSGLSAAGLPFLVWGLVVLDPWITLFGLAVQTTGKLRFLDRMALLYDDVSSAEGSVPPRTDR